MNYIWKVPFLVCPILWTDESHFALVVTLGGSMVDSAFLLHMYCHLLQITLPMPVRFCTGHKPWL